MDLKSLDLKQGNWVVANCGKFPSEKNCQLVIMAPEGQRQDLLDAAASHAARSHGHENDPQLRKQLDGFLEIVKV
jgi:hypothetical protein